MKIFIIEDEAAIREELERLFARSWSGFCKNMGMNA